MKSVRILFFILISCIGYQCNQDGKHSSLPVRGHAPWASRSVLDGQARMLTLALADQFWAAYSAENGTLYKVWRGSINFDGAVYTTVHGPQPGSLGDAYIHNEITNPWLVSRNGDEEQPVVSYKGHRFKKGQVHVNYDLSLTDGTVIHISERPEYLSTAEGKQDGFDRLFEVEGLPEGATLSFLFNYHSLPATSSLQSNGTIEILEDEEVQVKGLNAHSIRAKLQLLADKPTQLSTFFTKSPLIINENRIKEAAQEASQPLGARLIARSDCKSCHNTYVETIGPAYVSVAKRYENTESNRTMLANKIKNGGSGNWGEAAMTPHSDLDDTSLGEMVSYIMSLDADEEMASSNGSAKALDMSTILEAESNLKDGQLLPGLFLSIYQFDRPLYFLSDVNFNKKPTYQGRIGNVLITNSEFKDLEANFAIRYQGYINIPKDNNYVFRLRSDDGSRLFIGDQQIIDHDGWHGATKKDGEIALQEGWHPIRLDFFQGAGGKYISLEWKSYDDDDFEIIPKGQVYACHKFKTRGRHFNSTNV